MEFVRNRTEKACSFSLQSAVHGPRVSLRTEVAAKATHLYAESRTPGKRSVLIFTFSNCAAIFNNKGRTLDRARVHHDVTEAEGKKEKFENRTTNN